MLSEQAAAIDQPEYQSRQQLQQEAINVFVNGLLANTKAMEGLDFHSTYYQRGLLFRSLDQLQPNQGLDNKFSRDMRLSLRYCPIFVQAAWQLAEYLAGQPGVDMQQVIRFRRQVYQRNRVLFDEKYIKRCRQLFSNQRYREASMAWEQMLPIEPESIEWIVSAAKSNLRAGFRDRARQLFDRLEALDPDALYNAGGGVPAAAVKLNGDGMDILSFLAHSRTDDILIQAEYRALEMEAIKRTDRYQYANRVAFTRPDAIKDEDWQRIVYEARPAMLLHYLDEPEAARQAIEDRLALGGNPAVRFWIEGIYVALVLEDSGLAHLCLEAVQQANPSHPAIASLAHRVANLTANFQKN